MGDLKPSEMVAEACRDDDWQTDARARRLRDYSQIPEEVARLMTKVDAIIRYLDERREATAGLPQAATDEAAIDGLMAKRAAGLRETPMRGWPQAEATPAGGGESLDGGPSDRAWLRAEVSSLQKQVAALTAERDKLVKDRLAFSVIERRLVAERDSLKAKLRERDAVVEAAKAHLYDADEPSALALERTLAEFDALTQPTAGPVD